MRESALTREFSLVGGRRTDVLWAVLVGAAVVVLIAPMPTLIIDFLLAVQLAVAVALVLSSTRLRGRRQLAALPTALLVTTCYRLVLNVSTTRLILADGDAGAVVQSFGGVAVADNLVVGVVLLLIVALAQLLVVARGSERVAEVAARFSLDALPGAQLAIAADLRAGYIDAREASRRRAALAAEGRFYGAMDGAMRFVKGDALVALAIAIINLLGGLLVGVLVRDMSVGDAASRYLLLAIGDGLAAQIPALLVAMAAGLAITRAVAAEPFDDERTPLGDSEQSPGALDALSPVTLGALAVLFALLAAMPGSPGLAFASVAALAAGLWLWRWHSRAMIALARRAWMSAGRPVDRRTELPSAPLRIELSANLAATLDAERPDGRFARDFVWPLQDQLGRRLAMPVPPVLVHTGDVVGYRLHVHQTVVTQGLTPGTGDASDALQLMKQRLSRGAHRHACQLVDVQSVADALDRLSTTHPALLREVVPAVASRARVAAIVRALVRERIDFGDMATLLQALLDTPPAAQLGPPSGTYIDRVRCALRRQICARYAPGGTLSVLRLDPFLEDTLRGAMTVTDGVADGVAQLSLAPELAEDIVQAVDRALEQARGKSPAGDRDMDDNRAPVLLVAMDVRRQVAELIAVTLPDVVVLAPQELTPETRLQTLVIVEP